MSSAEAASSGSKVVETLREAGHNPLVASPSSGVDTITGEGLAAALAGARVVIDVSNAPAWDDAAVMNFFQTSARNILSAETAAGVIHHLALSVVGTERLPDSGYTPGDNARIAPTRLESWLRSTTNAPTLNVRATSSEQRPPSDGS